MNFRTALPATALLGAALVASAVLTTSAQAQDSKAAAPAASAASTKPVTVNGKTIPKSRIEFLVKERTAQGQPDSDQARKAITDTLVNQELLSQEAEKRGLTKTSDVQTQLELLRENVLANAVVADYLKSHPFTEDALHATYEKVKVQNPPQQEYHARHILVDKEDEAKDIIAKLDKGAKFDDLVKTSKDPGSKDRGGDLGWAQPGNFLPPFSAAMVKLEKGKHTTTPVQTQYGWHVIQLDEVRTQPFPTYEQAKPQLVKLMQQEAIQTMVSDLRSKAKIDQ